MNRKFVFVRSEWETLYKKAKNMMQQHTNLFEKSKYLFLVVWFFTNILFYGIYVNLSSTKWYFLSEAESEKEQLEFSYNITTLNMTEYYRTLRNDMHRSAQVKKIDIIHDVVSIEKKKVASK